MLMYKYVWTFTQNAKAFEHFLNSQNIQEYWCMWLKSWSSEQPFWTILAWKPCIERPITQIKTLTDNLSDSDNFCYAASESIVM